MRFGADIEMAIGPSLMSIALRIQTYSVQQ
jgi:hypothetical protein